MTCVYDSTTRVLVVCVSGCYGASGKGFLDLPQLLNASVDTSLITYKYVEKTGEVTKDR